VHCFNRGEDLGRISKVNVNIGEEELDVENSDLDIALLAKEPRKRPLNGSKGNFKRILRKASREELTLLSKKTVEETSVLEVFVLLFSFL
jgi:hypothetical protein